MSIKIIVTVTVLTLLSIYVAFLNPQKIDFHLTQHDTLHMPMVIFFLGSIMAGVLSSLLIYWFSQVKRTISDVGESMARKRKEKERLQWDILMEKGVNASLCESYEQAAHFFKKIINENPTHSAALLQLGAVYRNLKDYDRAIHIHSSLCESSPENIAALYALAEDYADAGKVEEQVQVLKKIRNKSSRSALPLTKMREALEKNQDWAALCDIQNKIVSQAKIGEERNQANHKLAEYTYKKALKHFSDAQNETALNELRRAIKVDPNCVPAYMKLGDAHMEAGNPTLAIKTWKAGFQQTGAILCLTRWQSAMKQGDHQKEIIATFESAVKASGATPNENLILMLAAYYMDNGQVGSAIETLKTHSKSTSIQQALLLASAYQEQGSNTEADEVISSLTGKVRHQVLEYVCKVCNTVSENWSHHCEKCSSWNSLACKLSLSETVEPAVTEAEEQQAEQEDTTLPKAS